MGIAQAFIFLPGNTYLQLGTLEFQLQIDLESIASGIFAVIPIQ